jgi:hypothetical protein
LGAIFFAWRGAGGRYAALPQGKQQMPNESFTVRLPTTMRPDLERLARENDRQIADFVRHVLHRYIVSATIMRSQTQAGSVAAQIIAEIKHRRLRPPEYVTMEQYVAQLSTCSELTLLRLRELILGLDPGAQAPSIVIAKAAFQAPERGA